MWIAASQAGDALAFNRLVLKWEKAIYNLALRMMNDPEDAAEVTQEVFLSAFKNIRKFRRKARFSTWLYRIAANRCITRLRRRPPANHFSLDEAPAAIPALGESHEVALAREESRERVRQALQSLDPEQRLAVELKFYQDLTFEEIAETLGIPASTVKSRLYSGLAVLKSHLRRERLR